MKRRRRGTGDEGEGEREGGSGFVTKFINVRVLRGDSFTNDDLWVECCAVGRARVIDPEPRFWRCSSDAQFRPTKVVDGRGALIVPGFIDLQLNGGFGIDFSSPAVAASDFDRVGRGILAHGVTAFLPTIVTSEPATYRTVLPRVPVRAGSRDRGAAILGAHLEGPFINVARKGAHNEKHIRAPGAGGAESLIEVYGSLDKVALVTLAPELQGATDTIKALHDRGVRVSLGHTLTTVRQAEAAVKHGASFITHLFNAMAAFHHRDPGLVGLLGADDEIKAGVHFGIIADGVHCHPSALKIAYRTHPKGLVLTTDSMAALGLPHGSHKLGDLDVVVQPQTEQADLGGVATANGPPRLNPSVVLSPDVLGRTVAAAPTTSAITTTLVPSQHTAQSPSTAPQPPEASSLSHAHAGTDNLALVDRPADHKHRRRDRTPSPPHRHPDPHPHQRLHDHDQPHHPNGNSHHGESPAAARYDRGARPAPAKRLRPVVSKVVLQGTDTLAGSCASMIDCIKNLVLFTECSVAEAAVAASLNPARVLGISDRKGHLGFGADADFVLLCPETLDVRATYLNGTLVWEHDAPR